MGVRIDNDNKIWFVNNVTKKVIRIDNPNVLSLENVVASEPKFSIYPNPTSGDLNISLEDQSGSTDIRIIDMSGKMVLHTKTIEKLFRVNTNAWAKGIYTILLTQNERTASNKVVVQ